MAKQPESILKQRVIRDLKSLPHTYVIKIQQVVIIGTPDILACVNGKFIAIELKKDALKRASVRQSYEFAKIRKAGGLCFLVNPDNWGDIFGVIQENISSF